MEAKTLRLRIGLLVAVAMGFIILSFPRVSRAFREKSTPMEDESSILVADRYIPPFTVIKPSLLRRETYPKHLVPLGALREETELHNDQDQLLFTSVVALPEGQPVTRALVTDAAQSDALGSFIRPGKVAVSFEVDASHGVGGWIRPGDTIAIFGMATRGARDAIQKMRLLLPSVMVLAVDGQRLGQGQKTTKESEGHVLERSSGQDSKVVTVLVRPSDASVLIEARGEGQLSVVLQSLGDDVVWNVTP